jgi:hypothetical protein
MSIVRTVFSRWFGVSAGAQIGDKAGEISQSPAPYKEIPPPIFSSPSSDFEKSQSGSVPPPGNFLDSIALRFGGYERRFSHLIAPLGGFDSMSPARIKKYFSDDLNRIVSEARKQPQVAQRLLSEKRASDLGLYERLVAVACGDPIAVLKAKDAILRNRFLDESLLLHCLKEVGKFRPYETGHILSSFFAQASMHSRLEIMREIVSSPLIGDKHMVGDMFALLMGHSTREERRQEIYPSLKNIIDNALPQTQEAKIKAGFLSALLWGWRSEFA